MHGFDLILTLTGGLTAALCFGYLTHRLKLSPIVGYLLAGVAVGPHTPGFTANAAFAEQFAEIGVILLMFGVGLHFNLEDLRAIRRIAIPGAMAQSLVATLLGLGVAIGFGWTWEAGIIFGLALAVASTVVLTRVLLDNDALETPIGHLAIGWLIIEDLLTVVVLVILPILFASGEVNTSIVSAITVALVKVFALVAGVFVLGGRIIPWLLTHVSKTKSQELFTLTILVTALGVAVGSAKLFDVSMALGAFLAGMVVGQSDFSHRAGIEVLPMRDAFAVLFFVSVGMLLDPIFVLDHWDILLASVAVVVLGKSAAAYVIVLLFKYPKRVAIGVAIALAQIGEFSFILASVGRQLGILDAVAMNTLVATAIVTISLNPLLFRVFAQEHLKQDKIVG